MLTGDVRGDRQTGLNRRELIQPLFRSVVSRKASPKPMRQPKADKVQQEKPGIQVHVSDSRTRIGSSTCSAKHTNGAIDTALRRGTNRMPSSQVDLAWIWALQTHIGSIGEIYCKARLLIGRLGKQGGERILK